MHPPADPRADGSPASDSATTAQGPEDAAAAPLEAPTGRFAVRGPTAFVLGLMLAVALASILRTCLA